MVIWGPGYRSTRLENPSSTMRPRLAALTGCTRMSGRAWRQAILVNAQKSVHGVSPVVSWCFGEVYHLRTRGPNQIQTTNLTRYLILRSASAVRALHGRQHVSQVVIAPVLGKHVSFPKKNGEKHNQKRAKNSSHGFLLA